MQEFATLLKRVRERKGLTAYGLARLTGLSQQGVLKLERPGSDPKLSTLLKLAGALKVPVGDLLPAAGAEGSRDKFLKFCEEAMPLLKQAKELSEVHVNVVSPPSIRHRLVLLERLLKGLSDELTAKGKQ
jgi:transcriptional regulator with XRE-family HTH domain